MIADAKKKGRLFSCPRPAGMETNDSACFELKLATYMTHDHRIIFVSAAGGCGLAVLCGGNSYIFFSHGQTAQPFRVCAFFLRSNTQPCAARKEAGRTIATVLIPHRRQ